MNELSNEVSGNLKGFLHPRSARGGASVIPNPPWYFSGTSLTVEYRTDPKHVAAFLPQPLSLAAEDPGAVAITFGNWQSCSTGGRELLDPIRSQYSEVIVNVRCQYKGRTFSRVIFAWVDRMFSFARGLHQGFPKKAGSVHLTRLSPLAMGLAPQPKAGAIVGASLAADERRLAQATMVFEGPSTHAGFVRAAPLLHSRWIPSVTPGAPDLVSELVELDLKAEVGPMWVGKPELTLFDSPYDELHLLPIDEIIAGYYGESAARFDKAIVLETQHG